jgi:hypothetical protein
MSKIEKKELTLINVQKLSIFVTNTLEGSIGSFRKETSSVKEGCPS